MICGEKTKMSLYIISEKYFVANPANSQKFGHKKNIVSKVFWTVGEGGTFFVILYNL